MMYQLLPTSVLWLSMLQNQLDHLADPHVHDKEKDAEKENGDDHDQRGGPDFHRGRPGDHAHLAAHVVQEFPELLWPGEQGVAPLAQPVEKRGSRPSFVAGDRLCYLRHFFLLHFHRISKPWQGRRDSNPHIRFWRPAVYR